MQGGEGSTNDLLWNRETQGESQQTWLVWVNKDYQRMMVDPMFMIVQSLRSYLTAVTPTTVAPIAVILPVFTWIYLNLPEFTLIYPNIPEYDWNPKFTWIYLTLPQFTWIFLNLPDFT